MEEQKYTDIDINLEYYDKDVLIAFIVYCHERNITFNDGLVELLTEAVKKYSETDKEPESIID
jgi:CRISPR/Cas system CSM-associated protein Csm2 small subunit